MISESDLILPIVQVDLNGNRLLGTTVGKLPFELPGYGAKTKFYCGQVYGADRCDRQDCGHVERVFKHSCNKWACPECYTETVKRAVRRASDRINGGGRAIRATGAYTGPVVHIALSPGPGVFDCSSSDWVDKIRRQSSVYLSDIGMIAFSIVVHPARVCDSKHPHPVHGDIKSKLRKSWVIVPYTQALADKHGLKPLYLDSGDKVLRIKSMAYYGGFWECVQKDILQLGGPEHYVSESPHVHAVGYMPEVKEKSNLFYLRTGWVYKNKGKRNTVEGTLFYLLTHHAVVEGKQAITYYEQFAYNKLRVQKQERIEDVTCSKCSCSCTRYDLVDSLNGVLDFSRSRDLGPSTRKITTGYYWLKGLSCTVPGICDKDRVLMQMPLNTLAEAL